MIFMKYLPIFRPKLAPKLKEQNLLKYVTFDTSIITWFIVFIVLFTNRSVGYLRDCKFKGFLIIFLSQSNISFCR